MNNYKGFISKEYTIWCGNCAEWWQKSIETKKLMIKIVKKAGWKFKNKLGWICPNCVNVLNGCK